MNEKLRKMFVSWAGEIPESIVPLPRSGSYRQYYRIQSANHQAIGVYNKDKNENRAFISLSNHFIKNKLKVPSLYKFDIQNDIYLIKDLGDTTLYSVITEIRNGEDFPVEITELYKKAINALIRFQVIACKDLDYSVCYPRDAFDRQSMIWDLHYFKYYFLKLTQTHFDEQKLENDFNTLTDFLLGAKSDFFMYRDFQSRNIMINDGELYFIDYQGGRKGALQYDVASLLYDAKADISQPIRDELLNHYISVLQDLKISAKDEFYKYYYGYVLIRILQALGAYGFRGIHEKKAHFLKSIPFAIKNIEFLLMQNLLPKGLSELQSVLKNVIQNKALKKIGLVEETDKLIVSVNSFSYRSGIPVDLSGNDGGFVFDCRSLLNPGRYEEFKLLTGNDDPVIEFLNKENDVQEFINDVKSITERAIYNYMQRGFSHLMINFGCTGGQHRSVYCTEKLADFINRSFNVKVFVRHTELEKKDSLK